MILYYFFTPNYEFWNQHIHTTLSASFDVRPLKITSLALQDSKVTQSHHFLNCTTKIELIIDCIEKNMGKHILFTDCTIFIDAKNIESLKNYMHECFDKDMTFAYYAQDHRNIGVILIHCTQPVLSFWKSVLKRMQDKKRRNISTWDQGEVNDMLDHEYSFLKCGLFDSRILVEGPIEKGTPFHIYKLVCDPREDRQHRRLTNLYNAELISKACYEHWLELR